MHLTQFRQKIVLILFILLNLVIFLGSVQINAQPTSSDITCLPSACQVPGGFEPDFACQTERILNPGSNCCINKCTVDASVIDLPPETTVLFEFFGNSLIITDGSRIPALINLLISTFLGFISLYAVIYGIYLGAYARPNATDEESIAQINKSLQSVIIGFALAWSFIFIIQFVASLLGLGDLSTLDLVGNSGSSTTITIQ